jgi:2-desacetyl-2-hydroxyethyl bacteriochlorophyllide A dehydrogenase
MKAIVFKEFGPSSVLQELEVPAPIPQPGEVLVKLTHTSVNPVDWKIRLGYLKGMFPHHFPVIPGWDAAGEVLALGEGVKGFAMGDRVFAYTRLPTVQWGTYAEQIALPTSYLARIPENISDAEAASVPLAGLTAYQALHRKAAIQKGDRVLILGGSGGVGSFAVQLARIAGATVTASSSTKNHHYLQSLGAHHVLDYQQSDLGPQAAAVAPEGFDIVFDTVGGTTLKQGSSLIKRIPGAPAQRIVSVVETPPEGLFHFVEPSGTDLSTLADLLADGTLRIPAITLHSIRDAAASQDLNAQGRTRGKIVLKIDF